MRVRSGHDRDFLAAHQTLGRADDQLAGLQPLDDLDQGIEGAAGLDQLEVLAPALLP